MRQRRGRSALPREADENLASGDRFERGVKHCFEHLDVGRLDQVMIEARLARPAAVLFLPPAGERDQDGLRDARVVRMRRATS